MNARAKGCVIHTQPILVASTRNKKCIRAKRGAQQPIWEDSDGNKEIKRTEIIFEEEFEQEVEREEVFSEEILGEKEIEFAFKRIQQEV